MFYYRIHYFVFNWGRDEDEGWLSLALKDLRLLLYITFLEEFNLLPAMLFRNILADLIQRHAQWYTAGKSDKGTGIRLSSAKNCGLW